MWAQCFLARPHVASQTQPLPGDAAANDSISMLFGKVVGSQFAENFARQGEDNADKQALLRGIQTAVNADSTQEAYLQGLSMGVRFAQQFNYFAKEMGVDVDRDMFMKEFKAAFTADSVSDTAIDQALLNSLMELLPLQRAEERKLGGAQQCSRGCRRP